MTRQWRKSNKHKEKENGEFEKLTGKQIFGYS